jgi:hypothetical protein
MKKEDFYKKIKQDQAVDSTEPDPASFDIKTTGQKGVDPEATRDAKGKKVSLEKLANEEATIRRIVDSFANPDTALETVRDQFVFIFNEEPAADLSKEDLLKTFTSELARIHAKQMLLRAEEN